jgi:rSAM/selenodomain-associated transferase 2/rSAM/selenodomain-associated transferase 1
VNGAKPSERLIIFTRYPEPGKTKTRLIPVLGTHGAADLQRQMTEHAINRVRGFVDSRPVGMEVRYEGGNRELMEKWLGTSVSYRPQGSGDLGARMRRAFAEAFQQGFSRVVIMGTDCPGVTGVIARTGFDLLSQFDLVLGAAEDGGYYLIGLRQEMEQLFHDMPWGTSEVRARTVEAANQLGLRVVSLDLLADVDRAEDFKVWEKESSRTWDTPLPDISIIIPTLNETENLRSTLASAESGADAEIIVVDGGSTDETVELAKSFGVRLLTTAASRAGQVNVGALAASSDVLLFLHGDTRLPAGFDKYVRNILTMPGTVAGAFALGIDGPEIGLRIIEKLANFRSRFLQMPYGDQAIFLRASLFRSIGGFPEIPIMEDFVFMRRVKKEGRVVIAPIAVTTSSRRWKELGILKTTFINQAVLLAYFLGSDHQRLARWYRRATLRE